MKPSILQNAEHVIDQVRGVLEADPRVAYAYVFGSFAKGSAHARSDLDIAVKLFSLPEGAEGDILAVDYQIEQMHRFERIAERRVDVVVLNRAPADLRHNIFRTGVLFFCRDRSAYARDYVDQLHLDQDRAHMSKIFDRYLLRRIEEGTFGGGKGNRPQAAPRD